MTTIAGPGKTTAAPGELLTEVAVPLPPAGTGSCYARLEYRQQMEIAVVAATAVVTLVGNRVEAAKVAITALAPTVPGAAQFATVGLLKDGATPVEVAIYNEELARAHARGNG